MPDPVPIDWRRNATQLADAVDKQARRCVLRIAEQAVFETRLRLVPILPAIGSQTVRIHLAKLNPFLRDFAEATHCLINTDRLGLSGDSDKIELACLNDLLGHSIGLLAEDERGAIEFVDTLETRGEVPCVADHGIRSRGIRADGADHG